MRVRTNGVINPEAEQYAEWLLQLGNGTVPMARGQQDPCIIELPPSLCMHSSTAELIDWTFPNLQLNYSDSNWLSGRCILAPKNTMVEAINKECLERIPCAASVCHSADAVVDEQNGLAVPPEYLHTLLPTGLPPHTLVLKEGIPIMLLRNLNPYRGLCNGTRLIVMHVLQGGRVLQAKIIGGLYRDNIVLIPRIALQPKDGEFPFEWRRRQFPVRVCFAMTINKSQGQTLERAGIYLPCRGRIRTRTVICCCVACLPSTPHSVCIAAFPTMHVDQEHCVQRSARLKLKWSAALLISCSLANKVTLRSSLPNKHNRASLWCCASINFKFIIPPQQTSTFPPFISLYPANPVANG